MQNLIQNAQWFSQSDGKILYFTNQGPITYDRFCMDNHRFCSLSLSSGVASNAYDPLLYVHHAHLLRFGYHMRSIAVEKAELMVTFYNQAGKDIFICTKDITRDMGSEFHDVSAQFKVPQHAVSAKISLRFAGAVTACTFGMPFAELYQHKKRTVAMLIL